MHLKLATKGAKQVSLVKEVQVLGVPTKGPLMQSQLLDLSYF